MVIILRGWFAVNSCLKRYRQYTLKGQRMSVSMFAVQKLICLMNIMSVSCADSDGTGAQI